jgi:TonB family protein
MKLGSAIWFCALLGCASGVVEAAGAAGAAEVRKTAEASMLVTGMVEVNPDGSLHGYSLDHPEKIAPAVIDVIGKSLANWEFSLSAPTTDVVKSKMSLRILAKPAGNVAFNISIAGASFGDDDNNTGDTVRYKSRLPTPQYPRRAIDARVSGTVYLLLRIGRDGSVQDVFTEQVNLDQYGDENAMKLYRKVLADASMDAAKKWTYNLPTRGKAVDDPFWVVRVPVNFNLRQWGAPEKETPYGSWSAYIPGTRQSAPWISPDLAQESPDAVPDGALHTGNGSLRLKTTLSGS